MQKFFFSFSRYSKFSDAHVIWEWDSTLVDCVDRRPFSVGHFTAEALDAASILFADVILRIQGVISILSIWFIAL